MKCDVLNLAIEALATAGRVKEAAALYPVAEDMIATGFAMTYACEPSPRTSAGIAATYAGNWARAEEHHQAALHFADNLPHKITQPIARYWYAVMLRLRNQTDDHPRARVLLQEALGMCESLSFPFYAGQIRAELAAL